MAKKKQTTEPRILTFKQVQGYQGNLKGEIAADRTGSVIQLDLRTAQALVDMCEELMARKMQDMEGKVVPGVLEIYDGEIKSVKNTSRQGYWRFHEHYDKDGFCDNPARGY